MPTFFTERYDALFQKADRLKELMDNVVPEDEELRRNARQALHHFLEQNPEMGPQRYLDYLGQDGPDRNPLILSIQP